ncbi:MAG: phosphotransferase [Pseudomonadota bacterium]
MLDAPDFPILPAGLTSDFLSLKLGHEVCAFTATPIGHETGFTSGDLVRLSITYRSGRTPGPGRLVAKFAPAEAQKRQRFAPLNRAEVAFYNQTSHKLPVPHCHFASFDPRSGASLVLISDVGLSSGPDFVQGCDPQCGALAIDALAQVHAAYWGAPELADIVIPDPLQGFDLREALAVYPDRVHKLLPDAPMSPRFLEICAALTEQTETACVFGGETGVRTLLHGDVHLDNLAFEPARALLFDWQFVSIGNGLFDLAYFLIGSFEPPVRRRCENLLLKRYLSILEARGVTVPDKHQAIRDYTAGVSGKILMTVLATVHFDNSRDAKRAWRAADLNRLIAFCEDHDVTPEYLVRHLAPAVS